MNHNYTVERGNLLLRPLQEEDIEYLRCWRNDSEQTKFLYPVGHITAEMQKNWFKKYLENPDEMTFAIVETKKLNRIIGSVALYNFTEDSAEIGKFLIGDPDARGCGYGSLSLSMAVQIAFSQLGRKRITTSVNQNNIASYRSVLKVGFTVVGNHPSVVGGTEDLFEVDYHTFVSNYQGDRI